MQKSPNAKVFIKYFAFFFFDMRKLMPAKVSALKVVFT